MPTLALVLGLVLSNQVFAGCSSQDENDGTIPPTTASPPILDGGHHGWKAQRCEYCHQLPVTGHEADFPSQCAACHGANGACDPNGVNSTHAHTQSDNCVACHQKMHSFEQATDCVSCHFASLGVVDCAVGTGGAGGTGGGGTGGGNGGQGVGGGATGLRPSSELTDNCFNWPAEEFSPSKTCGLATGLTTGEQAIDFDLKDVNGTAYTLGGLLQTKPVLLVFGAFT